ncbi:hypothetical protein PCASD_16923 [Puccinia coronata f. sp. avenae]|uniref:Uncharacterized protein n=1 Tax=Puccinia coronata f. sp. avenae TaxID=200324 RepID=A0A2N5T532_9BASI|nr:hypothetical protein PCASD_16923 [Puccinia coronata f. sp. avenae]
MTSGVDGCNDKGVEEAADPDGDGCSSSLSKLYDPSKSHAAPSKTAHKPACKLACKPAHKPARKPARKSACKPACKAAHKPAQSKPAKPKKASKPAKPKSAPCAPPPPTCHQHSHPNTPIPEADRHGCAICDVYWQIDLNNELQTSQRPQNTQEEHASAQPPVNQLTKKQEK